MYMHSEFATLNHLSFPSENMEATGAFFEKYFGCKVTHKTNEFWVMKHGNVDIVIESPKGNPTHWPKNFHFGFELGTVDEVRSIYETLKNDGIKIETEIFNNTRGSRFFARTCCGILFEVNTHQDMQPELWQNSI